MCHRILGERQRVAIARAILMSRFDAVNSSLGNGHVTRDCGREFVLRRGLDVYERLRP